MKRCESAVSFFSSRSLFIASRANFFSTARRRLEHVLQINWAANRPTHRVPYAVASKMKLMYILAKKNNVAQAFRLIALVPCARYNFLLQLLHTRYYRYAKRCALACRQVIFKLKKFASCRRSNPLFVAFSDEFKGSVLLRLLCSLALAIFLSSFFDFKEQSARRRKFSFLLLAESSHS